MIDVPARPISSGVILVRVRYERAKDRNVRTADFLPSSTILYGRGSAAPQLARSSTRITPCFCL